MSMASVNTVSIIIVALNAEKALPFLLDDISRQTIASEGLELILVDSASADSTRSIMNAYAHSVSFPVKVLSNPKKWLACGINLALKEATGDAVIRLDAHARIPEDFIEKNVAALADSENIVGGSVLSTPPADSWSAVMRSLDTSRFCGGAAPFRNPGSARYVDTLAYALYRRNVFDRVGFYDERLRRTEDNEMHYRMRQAGYRFRFCPEIVSTHAARDSLIGHIRQKWGNGYWIGRTMHIQPRCFAPRHFAPLLFVSLLILFGMLSLVSPVPFAVVACSYLCLDLYFTAKAALETPLGRGLTVITLPFLFPLLHFSYGLGTLVGLLTLEKKYA